jgi:hypothetical protein
MICFSHMLDDGLIFLHQENNALHLFLYEPILLWWGRLTALQANVSFFPN